MKHTYLSRPRAWSSAATGSVFLDLLQDVCVAEGRQFEHELVSGGAEALLAPRPQPAKTDAMSYELTTGPARVRASFTINTRVAKDAPLTVFGRTPAVG